MTSIAIAGTSLPGRKYNRSNQLRNQVSEKSTIRRINYPTDQLSGIKTKSRVTVNKVNISYINKIQYIISSNMLNTRTRRTLFHSNKSCTLVERKLLK